VLVYNVLGGKLAPSMYHSGVSFAVTTKTDANKRSNRWNVSELNLRVILCLSGRGRLESRVTGDASMNSLLSTCQFELCRNDRLVIP
jgi:hypothetical protein